MKVLRKKSENNLFKTKKYYLSNFHYISERKLKKAKNESELPSKQKPKCSNKSQSKPVVQRSLREAQFKASFQEIRPGNSKALSG